MCMCPLPPTNHPTFTLYPLFNLSKFFAFLLSFKLVFLTLRLKCIFLNNFVEKIGQLIRVWGNFVSIKDFKKILKIIACL
ncbi:unnamed protein product [Meloidogyne enterolobii]|uniref:Uncharacterized protein n=1 Tax=Meloidogyne enterolobii TaxID=390850 RepID=A0ACB0Y8F5_MELEN